MFCGVGENGGPNGDLDNDSLAAALFNYCKSPDRDTLRSPAQILFARQLKGSLPCSPEKLRLRPEWVLTAEAREKALSKHHIMRHSDLLSMSRQLRPLKLHDTVQVQNQHSNHANKWDLSGTIVEILDFDAYLVKMDGKGRISKRNRQFLRSIIPFNHVYTNKLPNQTFTAELVRDTNISSHDNSGRNPNHNNIHYSTGPTAVKDGRPSTSQSGLQSTSTTGRSADKAVRPSTGQILDDVQPSDDATDDFQPSHVSQNQRNHETTQSVPGRSHQAYFDTHSSQQTLGKRVRFATKRFIESC